MNSTLISFVKTYRQIPEVNELLGKISDLHLRKTTEKALFKYLNTLLVFGFVEQFSEEERDKFDGLAISLDNEKTDKSLVAEEFLRTINSPDFNEYFKNFIENIIPQKLKLFEA